MLRMFPRAFSLFFLSLLPLSLSSFHLLFPSLTFFLRPKICFGSALQRPLTAASASPLHPFL